jgi:hypothetical protein
MVQAHGGEEAIKHHPFFRDVKWKDLEERKIKPPFKPKIVSTVYRSHVLLWFKLVIIVVMIIIISK